MSDLILWNQLTPPNAVWVGLNDTVGAVRQQLLAIGGHGQYNAAILIRLEDGRIAPTDTRMLRKLAQIEGASILQRPLSDLLAALCPEPWTVESQGPGYPEAAKAASKRQLPVIVIEGGQLVGLMQPPSHRVIQPAYGKELFDLFDDPLPRAALSQTEFVTASAHATVARIAGKLKELGDPKSAYIVVPMEDGSFRVMPTAKLNDKVIQAGEEAWTTPLHRFPSLLQTAASREVGLVGQKQAQNLADQKNFLILIEQDRPVGLLPSSVVLREMRISEPTSHDALPSQGFTLFEVPESFLRSLEPRTEDAVETEPRYVNFWFEEEKDRPLDPAKALILGESYHLALNVGRLLELSIVDWGLSPTGPQAIVEPQEEAYLYVSLSSLDFDIPEPTKPLWLPLAGDTDTVHFQVRPSRRTWGADQAKLEVCLCYRAYLVQIFEVYAEILAPEQDLPSPRPQVAKLTHARAARFPDMAELPPRQLNLTISRDGVDRYRFTFLVDPDPQDPEGSKKALELSCLVHLTRDDLTHLITKARRQFYNVVQIYELLQAQNVRAYRRATRGLAQVGRQLYLRLFEKSSAQALKQWMEESLPAGSTIQIVNMAQDFVFPWSLVYAADPWQDDQPLDVSKFWGWRYKMTILTPALLDTYAQASTDIPTDAPLSVSVGLYERLKGIKNQKEFFDKLGAQTAPQVTYQVHTSQRTMRRELAKPDRDLYYFYCHGFTERVATDIQFDVDLTQRLAELAAEELKEGSGTSEETTTGEGVTTESQAAAKQDKRLRELEERVSDLFDFSDSWLRLTYGKLPLTMLRDILQVRFTRHPIVFLNMCQSAQVLPSLSDGFIPFFIQQGARAVIGTECSMNTLFADDFARKFLTGLFKGETMGSILLALRRYYLEQQNPLALAYTLYCDSDLRLKVPSNGGTQAPKGG
jgi:hypothetical protein